jgi:uncharacterized protein YndB with AHSA1/START domain
MPGSPTDPLGTLEQAGEGWRVRFVRRLPHSPERVWRALTEPAELSKWFPTSIDGDRSAGAALTFRFPAGQAPSFDGVMLVCEPPHVLELMWGPDRLRFELVAIAEGTELTLLDTLEALGKAARDAAGWHVCLDTLQLSLSGRSDLTTSWPEVHARYVKRFGPAAATIGPPGGLA